MHNQARSIAKGLLEEVHHRAEYEGAKRACIVYLWGKAVPNIGSNEVDRVSLPKRAGALWVVERDGGGGPMDMEMNMIGNEWRRRGSKALDGPDDQNKEFVLDAGVQQQPAQRGDDMWSNQQEKKMF